MAKILLTIFFAGYLSAKRDSLALARTKVLGPGLPARTRPRPAARRVARASLAVLVFETGPGHLAAVLRLAVAMLYVADPAAVLAGLGRSCSSPAGRPRLPAVRPRAGARRRLAAPVRRRGRQRLPDRAVALRLRERRHRSAPVSARATRSSSRTPRATSSSPRSVRSSASPGCFAMLVSTPSSSSAACGRRWPAATSSARCSPPVWRSSSRCRSSSSSAASRRLIPLTGLDHAVPLPGRILAGRQLDRGRAAAAHQRHRPAA